MPKQKVKPIGDPLALAYQHMIRTAMTTLKGYMEMAQDGDVVIGPGTARKLLNDVVIIEAGTENLLRLLTLMRDNNQVLTKAIEVERESRALPGRRRRVQPD